MAWNPIRYSDFYDYPRAFTVTIAGASYLFDCPFSEELDEYPDVYEVYELPANVPLDTPPGSWRELTAGSKLLGKVEVTSIAFDPSRRRAIDDGVLALLR